MKELIIDTMPFKYQIPNLNESTADGKMIVSGVIQRANTRNQNGRIYPKEILIRETELYNNNFVKEHRAVGELDHSASSVVNLKDVSHNILEMHWNGNDLIGTIEILPTPNGNILKNLIKSGILVGISSRGMGSVKNDIRERADIVQDDFSLISYDFVSTPSTQGAFMYEKTSTLNESVNHTETYIDPYYLEIDAIVHDILTNIN